MTHIVISLDFELRWGVQDKLGLNFDLYRRNLEAVRDVVPATLEEFARKGVRATWAIVGALACDGWDEWFSRAPAWPRYLDKSLHWHDGFRMGDPRGRLYFAPDLVDRVRASEGQELGSHTFSHVYMGEPGFVRADALGDAESIAKLFHEKWGMMATSLVFPRNQVAFADLLSEHGIRTWRANPSPFFWSANTPSQRSLATRLLRLADSVLPMGKRSFQPTGQHRASHFVRFDLGELAWRAHCHRLTGEAASLEPGNVLHLWWHPHNLGGNLPRSLSRLASLLGRLRDAAPPTTVFSNMRDIAAPQGGLTPS